MIKFILNNEVIQTSVHEGITLLDFVREIKQLKGTKIGCREGDCGACTVLVGTLKNHRISYESITSCISPLGNANGKHIITIEGINLSEELNVVQHSMANNYATQCGFCTPGFVVSMTGFAIRSIENIQNNNSVSCLDSISGNICRCTGYKSIEKAVLSVVDVLKKADSNSQIDWLIQHNFIPPYFKSIPQKLEKLNAVDSLIKVNQSQGCTVANGTDLYVQNADNLIETKVNLIGADPNLSGIHFDEDKISLGANTTATNILENQKMNELFPNLKSYLKLISSEQIRNMGTLGGNFVNASPIGDMSIFFLALNSTLSVLQVDGNIREVSFKDFHQNYKQVDLNEGELVHSISFNIPNKGIVFNFEKVSKRTHLDIASVNSALSVTVENDLIFDIHIAVGGVAAIPKYLVKTRQNLIGKPINEHIILSTEAIMQSEISPISDVRGSSNYKRKLASQLFFTHFIELFPNKISFQKLVTV